jgi:hypothetical protein
MKKQMIAAMLMLTATLTAWTEPVKVAILNFEDRTGLASDALLGGVIKPGALADKGMDVLARQLLGAETFVLVDRRDFIDQIEQLTPTDLGRETPTKPSFLHAAQALNMDVVLRGSLVSFSSGKQVVAQGRTTEFVTLNLRVSVEALDPVDGTVIAMADGAASDQFRQTAEHYTVLSEDDALALLDQAVAKAVPALRNALDQRQAAQAARPRVKISVKTSDDPAMVEVDGILVGTTPLVGFEVYKGDHVLTVGKPGHRDITKRILLEQDSAIEVPLMRTEMSAEEWKDILEKIRMNVVIGEPGIVITPLAE